MAFGELCRVYAQGMANAMVANATRAANIEACARAETPNAACSAKASRQVPRWGCTCIRLLNAEPNDTV